MKFDKSQLSHDEQLCLLLVSQRFLIGEPDYHAIIEWAENDVANGTPHDRTLDILATPTHASPWMSEIALDRLGFRPNTHEFDRMLEIVAIQQLQNFLDRFSTPLAFCDFAVAVDSYYIENDSEQRPVPSWVSKLWNACDWCDESWTLENVPHLVDVAKDLLRELTTNG